MKKTHKVLSFLCIILMLVTVFSVTASAADPYGILVTADKATVKPGDTVNITLSVPNAVTGNAVLIGLQGVLTYDADVFESVEYKTLSSIAAGNVDVNRVDNQTNILYFNNNAYQDTAGELNEKGELIQFTFKALKEADDVKFTFTAEQALSLTGQVEEAAEIGKVENAAVSVTNGEIPPTTPTTSPVPPKMGDDSASYIGLAIASTILALTILMIAYLRKKGIRFKEFCRMIGRKMNLKALRSFLAFALAGFLLFQTGAIVLQPSAEIIKQQIYTYGDVNGDGTVDEADRVLVRRYLVKDDQIAEENRPAADTYAGDGKIDLMDLAILQKRIDGIIYKVDTDVDEQPSDVFYEVFVRAFYDSDGDQIGDFKGLEQKIPYLAELGITGIWMMPITDSNSSHGYNTVDYYNVNDEYGTMEDFESLLKTAHQYGIKMVMDLVINHCGNGVSWFQEALKGPVLEDGSPNKYWDYFTFVPSDANFVDKTALEIQNEKKEFLANGGKEEDWVEQYPLKDNANDGNRTVWCSNSALPNYKYIGIFSSGMPDMNFDNPAVRQEFKDIAKFWLSKGLDGFRLDAARHIYGDYYSNIYTPEIFELNMGWWKEFRAAITAEYPDAYLIGEVWEKNTDNMVPFISEGGLHSTFNFNLASKMIMAAKNETTAYDYQEGDEPLTDIESKDLNIASDLVALYKKFGDASNKGFIDCTFLTNHDQSRVFSQIMNPLGLDPTSSAGYADYFNSAPDEDFALAEKRARSAASMMLTLPGNPFLYYGEEVGMSGWKGDTNIREAMPWIIEPYEKDADGNYILVGEGRNAKKVLTMAGLTQWTNPIYSLGGKYSVEAQKDDSNSLFSHYQELIYARTNIPALKNGGIDVYETGNNKVVSYIRMTEEQRVLVLINLSGETVHVPVASSDVYGQFLRVIFQSSNDTISTLDGETLTIAPYSTIVVE